MLMIVYRFYSFIGNVNFLVEEIMNFQQSDLVSEDTMLLDAKHIVYVWIGDLVKSEEKLHAYETALQYLNKGKNDGK